MVSQPVQLVNTYDQPPEKYAIIFAYPKSTKFCKTSECSE